MDLKGLPLFSQTARSEAPKIPRSEILEPVPVKHWTVSELTAQIRGVLEPSFTQIWVQGEISNCKPASSGHAYFSLKDAQACVSVAAFGWGARKKSFELKDGLEVLCRGKISVYPPRGSYQLVVDHIEPLGAGALTLAYEQLKEKLSAEGLFDSRRKRALPRYPKSIAVITSPSGAAIQDMLNILKRRAPHVQVMIVPALVQGEEAPKQLIRGVELANLKSLGEIIVLARGGGSIEDLWGFNSEALARAIAASRIPVVSAVGHETDFTISDFVSDLRAPTPSAAAELVTGHWVEAVGRLSDHRVRLRTAIQRELSAKKNLLTHLSARVLSPKDRLREQAQRCDESFLRLERAMKSRLERRKLSLEQWMGKLDALSPLRVLERGYAIVRETGTNETEKRVIRSAMQVQSGQELEIHFHDGRRQVQTL